MNCRPGDCSQQLYHWAIPIYLKMIFLFHTNKACLESGVRNTHNKILGTNVGTTILEDNCFVGSTQILDKHFWGSTLFWIQIRHFVDNNFGVSKMRTRYFFFAFWQYYLCVCLPSGEGSFWDWLQQQACKGTASLPYQRWTRGLESDNISVELWNKLWDISDSES